MSERIRQVQPWQVQPWQVQPWKTAIVCLMLSAILCASPMLAAEEAKAAEAKTEKAKTEKIVEVLLETSKGNIVIRLYPDRTPITVENFLNYVEDGHYDNTVVYRIEDFLIQMGSKKPDLYDKPKQPPIENEADKGLKNVPYTVGMARWGPHTADAEYYINTKVNPHLDYREKTEAGWGYCVFGKVIEGMDVVDAIAAIPTREERRMNLLRYPTEEVLIRQVTVRSEGEIPVETP